jgi:hypothetical protein
VSAESALTRVGIKFGEPKFQDPQIPSVSATGYAPVAAPGSVVSAAPGSAPIPAKPMAMPGAVLSQSPPAGYRVDVGSTVTLTVAK